MIFFFTGTGNSLHVAQELAKATGDSALRSIAQAVHDDDRHYQDEAIGIVCPNYGHFLPKIVQRFIEGSSFDTPYLYVVTTYGNIHGGAPLRIKEYLEDLGLHCNFSDCVLMVDNFLLAFDADEQKSLDKQIPQQIAQLTSRIVKRENYCHPVTASDLQAHEDFAKEPAPTGVLEAALQLDPARCTGCGICERVCPTGCFQVAEGLAQRDPSTCEMCMACINLCPSNAFTFAMGEANPNARFRNENVSLNDIARANSQIRRQ